MAAHKGHKKDSNVKDLLSKVSAKKHDPHREGLEDDLSRPASVTVTHVTDDLKAPITRTFLEYLFGALRHDFMSLCQELLADLKIVHHDLNDLCTRASSVEDGGDAR
ncbi:hypothetical protein NDU88_004423 [Pleurodeles waltl]|uniref:Uncharacterized protein n=1 Tax=Pleurodeles waltl TaxID=8319 RepID=A0AAV7QFD4_PLEWA|nr:hypothetical protein NDU88_004423 [Pleurodeles waltl]